MEEDLRNLLEQCAPSGAQTQSASLETSIISQNQESGLNPYSPAAFQCYWAPFAPASLERAARIADGIMPAAAGSTTIEKLSQTIKDFHEKVRRAGRNPEEMKWILRVHNPLSGEKATEPRALLGGTPQQAAEDLPRLKELGIDHIFYDMNHPAQVPK